MLHQRQTSVYSREIIQLRCVMQSDRNCSLGGKQWQKYKIRIAGLLLSAYLCRLFSALTLSLSTLSLSCLRNRAHMGAPLCAPFVLSPRGISQTYLGEGNSYSFNNLLYSLIARVRARAQSSQSRLMTVKNYSKVISSQR